MVVETSTIITAFFFFWVGVAAGYTIRDRIVSPAHRLDNRSIVMFVVITGWLISVMADIAVVNYQTPVYVHGIAGGVVGFFFKPNGGNAKK